MANFSNPADPLLKCIQEAVKKADRKDAKFIDNEKVSAWMKNWGTEKETELKI